MTSIDGANSTDGNFLLERVRDEAIIQLKTVSGKTAADIGAGSGFMSEGLLDAELRVIALDSSPEMVEFMKEKFGDIKEFKALLTETSQLKLDDESADYAFANMYLHNTEDPQTALKEIIRILKPGGKAAVTDIILYKNEEAQKHYHHRWPGFSFPDLYDWFINAEFRNISIEKLTQVCTYTAENGEKVIFELFIASGEK
jgi:ubiquinone/menaquinone biosynthesis C-methylase UbiE